MIVTYRKIVMFVQQKDPMKRTKVVLNLRKLKYKIKRKIFLRILILDQRNLLVRNQKVKEGGARKNGFVLGTEIIELTVDHEAAKDVGAMMFLHLQK